MASPREFLVFRLWGPMASWGGIAVGEQRQTWSRPSRSAVLGLIAAALGYERANQAMHARLEAGLGLAIRVDRPGRPLRDYHTAQSPSREGDRRWASRYDELRKAKKLNTILSERTYLTESSVVVVVWLRSGADAPSLATIADKLRRPTFALFLGRKASPLGIPLRPVLLSAATLGAALAAFDDREAEIPDAAKKLQQSWRWLVPDLRAGSQNPDVWLSAEDVIQVAPTVTPAERTQRRDSIGNRRTWTFEDRAEVRITLPREQTP